MTTQMNKKVLSAFAFHIRQMREFEKFDEANDVLNVVAAVAEEFNPKFNRVEFEKECGL